MRLTFDTKFFQKKKFEPKTIHRYFRNALNDYRIASRNKEPEVIFVFSYSALVKIGVTLIAFYGYRVKSRQGHHIKIIEKLSQILNDESVGIIGDKMRKKRNLDLYECGIIISSKEAKEYLHFVRDALGKAEKYLKSQNSLF